MPAQLWADILEKQSAITAVLCSAGLVPVHPHLFQWQPSFGAGLPQRPGP
ncbi:hypothetical protein DW089_02425 [Acidaminococcus sp. AM05-11]|nr:hypothetical protein DW089_02425 [Acidaminococcus sp. AM05-11]